LRLLTIQAASIVFDYAPWFCCRKTLAERQTLIVSSRTSSGDETSSPKSDRQLGLALVAVALVSDSAPSKAYALNGLIKAKPQKPFMVKMHNAKIYTRLA
jgi:hypothetical protein